jgi:hypothetical protein
VPSSSGENKALDIDVPTAVKKRFVYGVDMDLDNIELME